MHKIQYGNIYRVINGDDVKYFISRNGMPDEEYDYDKHHKYFVKSSLQNTLARLLDGNPDKANPESVKLVSEFKGKKNYRNMV